VIKVIKSRYNRGKRFSIIVIAEGAKFDEKSMKLKKENKKLDDFGRERLGGICTFLADEIERRTGFECRATILGHVQRGGMPSAFDRVLGTRLGIYAVEMAYEKKFGRMAALQGNEIVDIPITEAIGKLKTVDKDLYEVAQVFFK